MIWAFIFVLWSLKLDDRLGGVYGTSKNRVGGGVVVGVVVDQRWQKACGMWENTIFGSCSRFWDHFKTRKYSMSQCLTKNILNKYLFEKKIVPVTVKMQRRRISSLTTYIYTSNIIQYPPTLFLEILDVSLWFTLTCIKCMFFGTKSQLSTEEYLLHPRLNFYSKNL